ncbi:hypothetical protein [Streptomyces sp. NPDC056061]|uniref:hypothetical protein n=1 Tax=Streptomyces sp. NPDC056061 TaxID=3345700 RepID=UPI0035D948ED
MTDAPVFEAPFGGAMVHLTSPRDHRGYRHIVAWSVGMGATSTDFVKERCRQAEAEQAPKDAVYKSTPNPNSEEVPQWVRVGDIARPENRERVETYVKAMLAYEKKLKAYRKQVADLPPLHSYTLNVPATVTITVKAPSYEAAHAALAPADGKPGHEIKQITPRINGTLLLLLNREDAELVATDDPDYKTPPTTERSMPLST